MAWIMDNTRRPTDRQTHRHGKKGRETANDSNKEMDRKRTDRITATERQSA